MNRITDRHLDMLLERINIAAGRATTMFSDDRSRGANIGHYTIDRAYSGCQLAQIVNSGGGETNISVDGYVSKRELYNQMTMFLSGLTANGGAA